MSATLISIDPGSAGQGSAVAVFDRRGALILATYARANQCAHLEGGAFDLPVRVVVERPAAQGARSRGAYVGDLISLAWDGAALAYYLRGYFGAEPVTERTPQSWKGSQPKPQQHARAWAALDDAERALLGGPSTGAAIDAATERGALDRWKRPGVEYYPRSFKTHNLLDATALGLVTLGRMR